MFTFLNIALFLVLLAVLFAAFLIARGFSVFRASRRELDAHLFGVAAQLKKMQSTLGEMLVEERNTSRALAALLELKQAEMTGDFDIVEEPIAPADTVRPGSAELPKIN